MADSNLYIKQMLVGPMANYSYIVGDKTTKEAALIDPGWEGGKLVATAEKEGYRLTKILATHGHYDHANEIGSLLDRLDATLYIHKSESSDFNGYEKTVCLSDGEEFSVGNLRFKTIHTPGHTTGSVCYLTDSALFSGDTLFIGSIGRTDLAGGDAEEMFRSLQKLKNLPGKVVVYPGHEYGPGSTSTIEQERKMNPYMRCTSVADFFRMV